MEEKFYHYLFVYYSFCIYVPPRITTLWQNNETVKIFLMRCNMHIVEETQNSNLTLYHTLQHR